MKLGIVGLPNVGKSTLFNALTNAGAESANYPFCTIEPNVGVVTVPDERLDFLAQMHHPAKVTPAVIEFVDIAGLVKGASKGEGLGNQFLGNIREVDAVLHVIRCFEDDNIIHVDGKIDPMCDLDTINLELIFSDMEILERRMDRTRKAMRADRKYASELEVLEKIYHVLEEGKCARTAELTEDERACLYDTPLLTMKPVIYVANVSEDYAAKEPLDNAAYLALKAHAESEHSEIIPICCQIEAEIAELGAEEKAMFLSDLGIAESGLDRLIKASYSLLGLISFLTAGPDECRAWTIRKGTKAPKAAGKIHSDIERGFIRAETINFSEMIACGSVAAAKEKGLLRSEGKDYVVKDGDMIYFRFNV